MISETGLWLDPLHYPSVKHRVDPEFSMTLARRSARHLELQDRATVEHGCEGVVWSERRTSLSTACATQAARPAGR